MKNAKRTIVVVILNLACWGCYKCRTPDCRELPPGGEYPPARLIDAGAG